MTSTRLTWLQLFSAVAKAPEQLDVAACPDCGEATLAARFVASSVDRTGYAALWCRNCGYGIWVSRATVPDGWDYATFEEAAAGVIPDFVPVESHEDSG